MRAVMKFATVPAMGLAAAVLTAAPASADTIGNSAEAAQAAVDEYGGCTINVESESDGWEVEINHSDKENTDNHGRIEVTVDSEGNVTEFEKDSDNESCDPELPSSDRYEGDDYTDGAGDPIADFIDTIDVFGSLDVVKDFIE